MDSILTEIIQFAEGYPLVALAQRDNRRVFVAIGQSIPLDERELALSLIEDAIEDNHAKQDAITCQSWYQNDELRARLDALANECRQLNNAHYELENAYQLRI